MATTNYNLPTITGNMAADVVRDMNALAVATDGAIKQAVDNVDLTEIEQDVSEIDSRLTTYLADYEYQTATISGAQIRLTKRSNTNRLLFKVNSNVNGNITISTDNGATSKNLVDIDGNNVTSMEKGFYEIVLTGNFFILRNKGGLSKSDLEALITIVNEAEENESVLRTNYVNAVNSTDESISLPDNATWNDILLQIPNINATNKKWASGTFQGVGNSGVFQYANSTSTSSHRFIEVNGLSFTPSIIIARASGTDNVYHYTTTYIKDKLSGGLPGMGLSDTVTISVSNGANYTQSSVYQFKANSNDAYVNENGFKLPSWNGVTPLYSWIAFE